MHEPPGRPVVTLVLFLAAVLGWGAFAGIWHRLGQAEQAWHEQRARADEAEQMGDELLKQHLGLVRLMQSEIDHLEERLRAAEVRRQP